MADPVPSSESRPSSPACDTTLGEKTVRFLSRKLRTNQYLLLNLRHERAAIEQETADVRADNAQLSQRIAREFARNPRLFRGYPRP